MSAEALEMLADAASALAPATPELKHRRLFNKPGIDLFDEKGDYKEQALRVDKLRQEASVELFNAGGLEKVRSFAHSVAHPDEVGSALGTVGSKGVESGILPELLEAEDESDRRLVSGFVWGRSRALGWDWVDEMLKNDWSVPEKAAFLRLLPFQEGTWERVLSQLGADHEEAYWKSVAANPYGPDRDLKLGIEKLIEHGRPEVAIFCLHATVIRKSGFDPEPAQKALLAVLQNPSVLKNLDQHATVSVIEALQKDDGVNPDALFAIEWNFLPWLGTFSGGSPVTLEKRLASDPSFFAEVVGLLFRPEGERETDQPPSERTRALASNAYGLLREWRTCPGQLDEGELDEEKFSAWLTEVRRITAESGHLNISLSQIGHMLIHAPADPDGLWIHKTIAAALNERTSGPMRSGFTTALYNSRGVHGFTAGKEERELAARNREKADALDQGGYSRFATAMREFAESYEREAEREASRREFEDL